MGRVSRGQVAGLLSVLFVIGAAALAAAVRPHPTSVPESAQERQAIGPADVPEPVPTAAPVQTAPYEPPGPPRQVPTPTPPPLSPEEPFGRPRPGTTIYSSGPETRGTVIGVAGRLVQLPPDAYIANSVAFIQCYEPGCPEAPYYVLRRGESSVGVSRRTGYVFGAEIAPGEEGAFDFLREATR
jgi:hypothetical protein